MAPWPVEFVGGAVTPHAPCGRGSFPSCGAIINFTAGTGSRGAFRAAEEIVKRGGILSIFPEGGNWATVLRPPRPGTAYLATRTGVQVLPVGFYGFTQVFPSLGRFRRAHATIKIGRPIGPFSAPGTGRDHRRRLDEIGHEIMRSIADLLPAELRGFYSSDPAIRAAAKGTERYPWADKVEGEVVGEVINSVGITYWSPLRYFEKFRGHVCGCHANFGVSQA